MRRRFRAWTAALALVCPSLAAPAWALNAVVNYTDGAGTGFKDSTPVSPVGGNTGATLGDQRKQAFEFAVNVWAQRLQSSVTVTIDANFTSQFCGPASAQLGNAGPALLIPASGMPQANTYYPVALANAIKGGAVVSGSDISAHFNGGIDSKPPGGCLGSSVFYYGFDQNTGGNVSFVNVAVHELGHGFGFISLVDPNTGAAAFGDGKFGILDYSLFDENTAMALPAESNSQRAAAAVSNGALTWNDAFTNAGNGFLDGVSKTNGHVRMFAPSTVQSGSSMSHWDTAATPDLVMEPSYTPIDAGSRVDLTTCAFKDIGWTLLGGVSCPDIAGAAAADLAITQTDSPDPAVAGSNVTYTITLHNNGGSAASGVSVSDPLPGNTTFVSLTKPAGWSSSAPAAGATGTVAFTNPSLASGATAVFKVTAHLPSNLANGGTLSNTATVSSSTSDPVPSNNAATASTSVTASSDLSITNAGTPDPVVAGKNITYTIVASGTGPSAAANTVVTDTLSPYTTFVSVITPTGWSASTPAVGASGKVTFSNAMFNRGTQTTFKVVVKVAPNAAENLVIKNTAAITSATPDPSPSNNSALASTTSNRSANVTLAIVDAPDPVHAGDNLTYTVTFTNKGPSTSYGLTMTDNLPANTTFVSNSGASGWTCTNPAVGSNGTISCTATAMNPTSTRVFTIVAHVDAATANAATLTNSASVAASTADPFPGNNNPVASTSVQNP